MFESNCIWHTKKERVFVLAVIIFSRFYVSDHRETVLKLHSSKPWKEHPSRKEISPITTGKISASNMAQNCHTAENPFDDGDQKENASSLHPSPADESFVSFKLPFYQKCVKLQKCYLGSFPLLPEGSTKSIMKLSLGPTGMEDFYIAFDSAAPNPSNNDEYSSSVNIRPIDVTRRPSGEPESKLSEQSLEPGHSSSYGFRKLPSIFTAILHQPIGSECTALVLFQLGNRCFPFCVEHDEPTASIHVSFDDKIYFLMDAITVWDPPSSDESLTVTALINNRVYVTPIRRFNVQKKIELMIGRKKYHIVLGSLESNFNAVNVSPDSHFFTIDSTDIPMRANSWHEIALPRVCRAEVFSRNYWFKDDEVKVMKRCFRLSPYVLDEKVDVKIGTIGTLMSHETGKRVFVGNGLFRIFITETNSLVALQKYLKISLKLSLN